MARSFRIMVAVALTSLAAQGAAAAGNPLARGTIAPAETGASIAGTWNGTDLEKRSACTHPENEGSRGTYAQFEVSTNASTSAPSLSRRNCSISPRPSRSARRLKT